MYSGGVRPAYAFAPLAVPIAAALVFTVVPSGARIPAFLAMIGAGAAIALAARQNQKPGPRI
jgi:hypothetical protein